jgi:hypothetical protein
MAMKVHSAKSTMATAENPNQFFAVELRLRESMQLLNHRYIVTPDEAYYTVAMFWNKEAKLDFKASQVEMILSLYPRERILFTLCGNTINPDVAEELLSVLSHFFLGCKWPGYGDSVDMERFVSLLQHQFNNSGL